MVQWMKSLMVCMWLSLARWWTLRWTIHMTNFKRREFTKISERIENSSLFLLSSFWVPFDSSFYSHHSQTSTTVFSTLLMCDVHRASDVKVKMMIFLANIKKNSSNQRTQTKLLLLFNSLISTSPQMAIDSISWNNKSTCVSKCCSFVDNSFSFFVEWFLSPGFRSNSYVPFNEK